MGNIFFQFTHIENDQVPCFATVNDFFIIATIIIVIIILAIIVIIVYVIFTCIGFLLLHNELCLL